MNAIWGLGLFLFVLIVAFVVWRIMNNKIKKQASEIPQDVIELFNEAERRLKESNGTKNPNEILYEIGRERARRTGEIKSTSTPTERDNTLGIIAKAHSVDARDTQGSEGSNHTSVIKRRNIFARK